VSNPIVFMNRRPIGGLGNQIFQYNFIFQIASLLNKEVSHVGFPKLDKFMVQRATPLKSAIHSLNAHEISLPVLKNLGWTACIERAKLALESNKSIKIVPGVLGEFHKEVTRVDPREFLKLQTDNLEVKEKEYLAVHFRGTDFYQWNRNAVMKKDYYLRAIRQVENEIGRLNQIKLYSDDVNDQIVKELSNVFNCSVSKSSEIDDFSGLMKASAIVASPSTFVFWAALLGNCKNIYYSKEWLDYATDNGMKFWHDLRNESLPFFPKVIEV